MVFDDLAQEALTTCRRSLTAASEVLGSKKDKAVDGRLFLVRHLLILKEMTAGLQLGRRDRSKEWTGITGTYSTPTSIPSSLNLDNLVIWWKWKYLTVVDFLKGLLDNASTMLGYARTSIIRANEHSLDAKIVSPARGSGHVVCSPRAS